MAKLQRVFGEQRDKLLAQRKARQDEFDAERCRFPPDTGDPRGRLGSHGNDDIVDRRWRSRVCRSKVVITRQLRRECVHCGLQDANTPRWDNNIEGHINLRDAVRRRIEHVSPKARAISSTRRPRSLVPREDGTCRKHMMSTHGGLRRHFDFACTFSTAKNCWRAAAAPILPAQAREPPRGKVVNDIFVMARGAGNSHGSIKATVLIETILAAFEMDEILYELADIRGPQLRPRDYIFSSSRSFAVTAISAGDVRWSP